MLHAIGQCWIAYSIFNQWHYSNSENPRMQQFLKWQKSIYCIIFGDIRENWCLPWLDTFWWTICGMSTIRPSFCLAFLCWGTSWQRRFHFLPHLKWLTNWNKIYKYLMVVFYYKNIICISFPYQFWWNILGKKGQ